MGPLKLNTQVSVSSGDLNPLTIEVEMEIQHDILRAIEGPKLGFTKLDRQLSKIINLR